MSAALTMLTQVAATRPEALALITANQRMSYTALAAAVATIAEFLSRNGVAAGDRVVAALPSGSVFVSLRLAVERIGGSLTPLEPGSGALDRVATELEPHLIVCADAREAQTLSDGPTYRLSDAGEPPHFLAGLHLFRRVAATAAETPAGIGLVLYTSGSTGQPKGVMMTRAAVDGVAAIGRELVALRPYDRVATLAPFSHFYAMREIDAAIAAGAALIVAPVGAYPAAALALVRDAGATGLVAVPRIVEEMLTGRARPLFLAAAAGLRYIALGTAHVSRALRRELRRSLPGVEVLLTYGLTECSRVACGFLDETPDDSVGRPAPGVTVEIRTETGASCPPGTRGRVHVRSPLAMAGVWSASGATPVASDAAGFLATADRGRLDADGFLFLDGRLDDKIDVGGFLVSLGEIAAALASHPAVTDAAAVPARPAGMAADVACAAIVLAPGAAVDSDALMSHAGAILAAPARPRLIRIVTALPRSAMGKIDGSALRAMFES